MTVELHVGYVGVTREGKRVEIVSNDGSREGCWPWLGDDIDTRNGDGTFWSDGDPSPRDIIGPWAEPDTQEPREFWIALGKFGQILAVSGEKPDKSLPAPCEEIHVREVTE